MKKSLPFALGLLIVLGAAGFYFSRGNPEQAQAQTSGEVSCRGWSTNTTTKSIYTSDINYTVGVGNKAPTERLDVTGNIKASGNITSAGNITAANLSSTGLSATNFTMANGAGAGKVLTSDASGAGTWQSLPAQPVVPSPYGFGGMYQSGPHGRWTINPVTGASNCPAGFKDAKMYYADCDGNGCSEIHLCWK